MAPRLSRWIVMTTVAAALVAVLFLTTGGTPLLLLGYGDISPGEGERTLLQRRIEGVRASLIRVRATREALELRGLLRDALRRTAADPVVFRWSGTRLAPAPALTAELQPLWGSLAERRSDVRTVVIVPEEGRGWHNTGVEIDPAGVCTIRPNMIYEDGRLPQVIRRMGGECLFAERFGAPGRGTSSWLRSMRPGIAWDRTRLDWWGLQAPFHDDGDIPAWFLGGTESLDRGGGGWRFRPIGRARMACLVGRPGQCEAAAGVNAAGWPDTGEGSGFVSRYQPYALLPRDLLNALGPERFGRIWSDDAPMATAYRRATGASMDEWLRGWSTRYLGTVERDNGLSLVGWVGALVWLSLLGLLTAERLKQRSVT